MTRSLMIFHGLLIVLPSVERGGAEDYSLTLAHAANLAGWEVHAAFSERQELRRLADDFVSSGVKYHPLEIADVEIPKDDHFRESFSHIWPLSRLVLETRPDAVALVLCGIDYALGSQIACAASHVPTALVFQLVPPNRVLREPVKRLRRSLMSDHAYVTVSDNNRYALAESLQSTVTNIHVVPNGVDFGKYSGHADRNAARQSLLSELQLPGDSKIILTVGRLSHQKGHDLLVAAAKNIVSKYPNARFVWAGEGPDRESLTNSIAAMGLESHIKLLGQRSDIPALLAGADLFVLPARFEGQPFALLEAMAARTPVIASHASGISEIVENKVHGLLFTPDDSTALGAAILEALDNPILMIECARQANIRAKYFSADTACATVLKFFDDEPLEADQTGDVTENREFQSILLEQIDAQPLTQILEAMAPGSNTSANGTPEPHNFVGGFAMAANYLSTDYMSPYIARLHSLTRQKLERSYSDEGAWALAAMLAFRHGVQSFHTMLKDPRNIHHMSACLIELIAQIDTDEAGEYIEWLSHAHPDASLRRLAMEALLRGLTRMERAQEWWRMRANGRRAGSESKIRPVRD